MEHIIRSDLSHVCCLKVFHFHIGFSKFVPTQYKLGLDSYISCGHGVTTQNVKFIKNNGLFQSYIKSREKRRKLVNLMFHVRVY